jgi:hypothetical protein
MYIIIGNSPRKVELKDLGDCVYYKQQKIYTDAQYQSSEDLKKAIERKDLLILKKVEETKDLYLNKDKDLNISFNSSENSSKDVSNKIDLLLEKIYNLEKNIEQKSSPSNELLLDILDRIEKLEKNLTNIDFNTFKESIKKENNNIDIEKVTKEIINNLKVVLNQKDYKDEKEIEDFNYEKEEVYVPNIVVEDATSNIKLEVRTVENNNNISESLKKLKELKFKSDK